MSKIQDKIANLLIKHYERVIIDLINRRNHSLNSFLIGDCMRLFDEKSKIYEEFSAIKIFSPLVKNKMTNLFTCVSSSFLQDRKALGEHHIMSKELSDIIDIDLDAGDT